MSNLRNVDKYVNWDAQRRQFLPVYWRREILPKWLTFETTDVIGPATINAAGAATPPVGFKQPFASVEGLDGGFGTPFEVRSLVFESSTGGAGDTATAAFTVLLKDNGSVREFMNRPIHIRTLAGVAQTPALLREPYMFLSQQNISATFNKITGAASLVRMYMIGAEYFPWSPEFMKRKQAAITLNRMISRWIERRKYVNMYWLTTTEDVTLAANGTADFFLKVGDDGHFEGLSITSVSTGNFEWELSEPKTSQTIMNGVATQTNGLGDANFPTLLPTGYLVPGGFRLRLRVTDLSGAQNQIFFTIGGRKIYAPFREIDTVLRDTAVQTPADSPVQMIPGPVVS